MVDRKLKAPFVANWELAMNYTGATRFKVEGRTDYGQLKTAAESYISNLAVNDRRGLHEKPLDWRPGHPSYFHAMYQLLNALSLMRLATDAYIVEVGSGAGWATEVMASLRYKVHCVEPSAEMIDVAKVRVASHLRHHQVDQLIGNVSWQCSTIEESDLSPETADAVIFFESFHHVINEEVAAQAVYDVLKPGGQLVIVGDSNWIPGNIEQETAWLEEMDAYGTLESPFTADYLTWVLELTGFRDVSMHHSVNGMIPVSREAEPVRDFAQLDAKWVNLVRAVKRSPDGATQGILEGDRASSNDPDLSDIDPEPHHVESSPLVSSAGRHQSSSPFGTRLLNKIWRTRRPGGSS